MERPDFSLDLFDDFGDCDAFKQSDLISSPLVDVD